jgi:hypothetical protein
MDVVGCNRIYVWRRGGPCRGVGGLEMELTVAAML